MRVTIHNLTSSVLSCDAGIVQPKQIVAFELSPEHMYNITPQLTSLRNSGFISYAIAEDATGEVAAFGAITATSVNVSGTTTTNSLVSTGGVSGTTLTASINANITGTLTAGKVNNLTVFSPGTPSQAHIMPSAATSNSGGLGLNLSAGDGNGIGWPGGTVSIDGGNGATGDSTHLGGAGGNLSVAGGGGGAGSDSTAAGAGGNITITGGSAGTDLSGGFESTSGGSVSIEAGVGSGDPFIGLPGVITIGTGVATTISIGSSAGNLNMGSSVAFSRLATFEGGMAIQGGDSTGTPGDAVLNTASGKSTISAGQDHVTITNSYVGLNSLVHAWVQQAGADATMKQIVRTNPAAGSFVAYGNAAATANVVIAWIVIGN